MKQIKFILVNENACQNATRLVRDSFVSDLRQCHVVEPGRLNSVGFKFQGSGSIGSDDLKQRNALIAELVRLRRHHPDAKILGISELGPHCVLPSGAMNALRRELSDLP